MSHHLDLAQQRELKAAELHGRRCERNTLKTELDRFVQTHEDASVLRERLAGVEAAIARLEAELGAA